MSIETALQDDPLIGLKEIGELLGPKGKPLSERTVRRYMGEPDGLAYIEMGGRTFARLSAVREYILRRERRPNPRRRAA